MHNEEVKDPLHFVSNGETLDLWQTFLEITQKFAEKMSVKGERGYIKFECCDLPNSENLQKNHI